MDTGKIIEGLRQEAAKNPAVKTIFTALAKRIRGRQTLTISSLYQRMKREGAKLQRSDYVNLISVLYHHGIGEIDYNKRGAAVGIKNIKVSLPSLSQAVIGDQKSVKPHKVRPKFEKMPHKHTNIREGASDSVNLDIVINDKHLYIPIPKDFTASDIANLVNKLQLSQ